MGLLSIPPTQITNQTLNGMVWYVVSSLMHKKKKMTISRNIYKRKNNTNTAATATAAITTTTK
jgi:hypothetical protein